MSTITSTGLGSGLDIQGMVTKLIAAEGQAETLRLNTKQANVQADLSALGTLKSALSTFQASMQGLEGVSAFQANTATSSNTDLFTATADGSANPGNFSVTVDQLAQAAKMRSVDFTSDTALAGAGTLAISLGTSSFTITTDSTTTLAGVRDAINKAADNPGITASIIKVDSGSQLLLTSNKMGAANTISIGATATAPSPGNDLTRLATANLTAIQTASDAIIHVDGQQVTKTSNSFSDVIPGVTITLNKADPVTTGTLSITPDPATTISKIQGFVSAYNSLAKTMSSLSSYDATTKTGAPLLGDATLQSVKNQIRQALSNPVQGVLGFSTLAEIGITTDSTGALVLDSTKLNSVMTSNPAGVSKLFASGSGLALRFDSVIRNYLSYGGTLSSRVDGDNKQLASLTDQLDKLNTRLTALQNSYLKQFNAMDALVGQFQSTGTYLTQQLANLPGFTNNSKN